MEAEESHFSHAGDQMHRENPFIEVIGNNGKAFPVNKLGYSIPEPFFFFREQIIDLVVIHSLAPFHASVHSIRAMFHFSYGLAKPTAALEAD